MYPYLASQQSASLDENRDARRRRTVALCRAAAAVAAALAPHYGTVSHRVRAAAMFPAAALWHCVAPCACRRNMSRRRTLYQLLCLG